MECNRDKGKRLRDWVPDLSGSLRDRDPQPGMPPHSLQDHRQSLPPASNLSFLLILPAPAGKVGAALRPPIARIARHPLRRSTDDRRKERAAASGAALTVPQQRPAT